MTYNVAAGIIASSYPIVPASGLQAWYDFTAAKFLTLSSTAITQALDRSGNGNNTAVQGTAAARPTFTAGELNGLPTALFDGGDTLALPSALYTIPSGPNTLFAVSKNTDNLSARRVLAMTDAGNGRYRMGYGTAAGGISATTMSFSNTTTNTIGVDNTGSVNPNYQIISCFRTGTTESISINNATAVTNTLAGDITATGAFIGSQGGTIVFLVGGIAEILIYNRALNSTEIIQVNRYLSQKYAIAIS